jgi:hypothetical protein
MLEINTFWSLKRIAQQDNVKLSQQTVLFVQYK